MDEPFSSIDRALKFSLRKDTKEILKNEKITSLIVSHDFNDALEVADKLAILDKGKIAQIGDPRSVVLNPINNQIKNSFFVKLETCFIGSLRSTKIIIIEI